MLQAIVDEISQEYSISSGTVKELIERATGECLSRSMGIDAYSRLDDEALRLWRFDEDRGEVPIKSDRIHRRLVRSLRASISRLVRAEAAVNELEVVKRLHHTAVEGVVQRVLPSGDVAVLIEVQQGREITAICPGHALTPSDFPVRVGQQKVWFVTMLELKAGSSPRLDMQLSRRSKELVGAMIRQQAALVTDREMQFSVIRRVPGQFTEIHIKTFIPHVAIKNVAVELGEKITFWKGVRHARK